jgi:hypothetical protein
VITGAVKKSSLNWEDGNTNLTHFSTAFSKLFILSHLVLAEKVGFEPTLEFPLNTLSKRAPSTTRPPLQQLNIYEVITKVGRGESGSVDNQG